MVRQLTQEITVELEGWKDTGTAISNSTRDRRHNKELEENTQWHGNGNNQPDLAQTRTMNLTGAGGLAKKATWHRIVRNAMKAYCAKMQIVQNTR